MAVSVSQSKIYLLFSPEYFIEDIIKQGYVEFLTTALHQCSALSNASNDPFHFKSSQITI